MSVSALSRLRPLPTGAARQAGAAPRTPGPCCRWRRATRSAPADSVERHSACRVPRRRQRCDGPGQHRVASRSRGCFGEGAAARPGDQPGGQDLLAQRGRDPLETRATATRTIAACSDRPARAPGSVTGVTCRPGGGVGELGPAQPRASVGRAWALLLLLLSSSPAAARLLLAVPAEVCRHAPRHAPAGRSASPCRDLLVKLADARSAQRARRVSPTAPNPRMGWPVRSAATSRARWPSPRAFHSASASRWHWVRSSSI
jgi:hypothetical protein